RREETGLPAFVHALYLVNLATPDDAMYEKSVDTMRATVEAACALEADAVIFHVGSHLGAGFDAGLERVVPALSQVVVRSSGSTGGSGCTPRPPRHRAAPTATDTTTSARG